MKREEDVMSSAKHFTEVLIGGKVYTLSGFEGEEYLQKVSSVDLKAKNICRKYLPI